MAGEDRLVRTATAATEPLDVARLREDFPILRVKVRGKPLVYLDSAASAQKPQMVIDAVEHFYVAQNSNVHRGLHRLSEQATLAFEGRARNDPALPQRSGPARDRLHQRHHRVRSTSSPTPSGIGPSERATRS